MECAELAPAFTDPRGSTAGARSAHSPAVRDFARFGCGFAALRSCASPHFLPCFLLGCGSAALRLGGYYSIEIFDADFKMSVAMLSTSSSELARTTTPIWPALFSPMKLRQPPVPPLCQNHTGSSKISICQPKPTPRIQSLKRTFCVSAKTLEIAEFVSARFASANLSMSSAVERIAPH